MTVSDVSDLVQVMKDKAESNLEEETNVVSSGSQLLDQVLGGGYPFGKIVNIIGDSSAGKTFFACEAIYKAMQLYGAKLKKRYNDCESGFSFDTQKLYGFDLKSDMTSSRTIEDFIGDIGVWAKSIKSDEFGIYVIDSFDGLCSDADIEEYNERIKKKEKGEAYKKGTYDMGKQKFASKMFRTICTEIEKKNIMLIIISQIRDNVNASWGANWTVSGGKALKFYSTIRMFIKEKEQFEIQGRSVGYCAEVTGMKTRSEHPFRSANINLLFSYGMDNISTNIDYFYDLKDDKGKLVTTKCNSIIWGDSEKEINKETVEQFCTTHDITKDNLKEAGYGRATVKTRLAYIQEDSELMAEFVEEFGAMTRDQLVAYIEDNDLEQEIADKAIKKWKDIEIAIKPKRKSKKL